MQQKAQVRTRIDVLEVGREFYLGYLVELEAQM